jgi:hypothetical protein
MSEHRRMWKRHHGEIPDGHHIHHINGIHSDNRIENLVLMGASEHLGMHFSGPRPENARKDLESLICERDCDDAFDLAGHVIRRVNDENASLNAVARELRVHVGRLERWMCRRGHVYMVQPRLIPIQPVALAVSSEEGN